MRTLFFIIASLLTCASPALAQRAVTPVPFRPYVPPRPVRTPPLGQPALCVYPDLTAFFRSAMYFEDFPREYALSRSQTSVAEAPPPPPAQAPVNPAADPGRAKITVQVPVFADVFVEGQKLKQTGGERVILSPLLEPGRRYRYQIVVRWNEGAKMMERKLDVPIFAGDRPVLMVLGRE